MLKRRAEHGAARERYSAPNKRHSAPFDRSAQFREVSNIEHYVGYRACKTYLHHRTLPWLMPVTESAACSRLIQTGKEEPMLRSRSHPQTFEERLAEQKARLEKRHPS